MRIVISISANLLIFLALLARTVSRLLHFKTQNGSVEYIAPKISSTTARKEIIGVQIPRLSASQFHRLKTVGFSAFGRQERPSLGRCGSHKEQSDNDIEGYEKPTRVCAASLAYIMMHLNAFRRVVG